LANSDATYRALREAAPSETYNIENIELKRDVATLTLKAGKLTFLGPVRNRIIGAVFSGQGKITLSPVSGVDAEYLARISGQSPLNENFNSAVFYFTDETEREVKEQAKAIALDGQAAGVLKALRSRLRHQNETPRTVLEAALSGEDIPNVEADMLTELYDPDVGGSFRAYLKGEKYDDLRFFVVPQGALPMLPSPEEVALMSIDPIGLNEGIFYLSHRAEEWAKGTASSNEDKRLVKSEHYRIDTRIAGNRQLTAMTEVRFRCLLPGARVLRFGLLPSLRVSRVTDASGKEQAFIQEERVEDSSFYVVLAQPLAKNETSELRIEYTGDRVIRNEGGGNFAVGARTSWYANLNLFLDRTTYEMTYSVPKRYMLISAGQLVRESKSGDESVSQWMSDIPLAVVGFNYGEFVKKQATDDDAKYLVEAYASKEIPDYMKRQIAAPTLQQRIPQTETPVVSPSAMAEKIVVDGRNSMRVFQHYYGAAPYGRIALTQQPQFNFGQSWPGLVYLPASAFLDSTTRWMMMGANSFRMSPFIQEVTPHEVAHQWWGHMVGWSTYHDQWLSEGFADFSAGLFLEATEKPDQVEKFWERQRLAIIEKNSFGYAPNDAGPLWMGLRLDTPRTGGAYNRLVYPKGAYVLQMLRMMMSDVKTGDNDFIAMMKDFVQARLHQTASTEDFQAIAEKHIKPVMDARGDHKLDWFFREWVYGNELPKYRLEYKLTPGEGGKVQFTGKLTQDGVSENFVMKVPVYFDFDGKLMRAGMATLNGNSSFDIKVELPRKPKRVLINGHHDVLAREVVVKEL